MANRSLLISCEPWIPVALGFYSCALYTFYDLELRALRRRLAEFQALNVHGRDLPASHEKFVTLQEKLAPTLLILSAIGDESQNSEELCSVLPTNGEPNERKAEYGRMRQMRPVFRTPDDL
jgi:hypothetical protein